MPSPQGSGECASLDSKAWRRKPSCLQPPLSVSLLNSCPAIDSVRSALLKSSSALFDQHFPTDGALAAQIIGSTTVEQWRGALHALQQRHPQLSAYPIRKGDEILVHAGAGGVDLLLTQMAKTLGAVFRPPCLRWKRLRSHLKQALMKFFGTRKWILLEGSTLPAGG